MTSPAHTVRLHAPRTPAQRLLVAIDARHVRCPVDDIKLPKSGGWWFGHGYLQLKVCGRETARITNVWIDPRHRGRGCGGRMLRAVCRAADAEGVALELFAQQFDRGGMRTADLWKWYEKHGFIRRLTRQGTPYVNGYATRHPR